MNKMEYRITIFADVANLSDARLEQLMDEIGERFDLLVEEMEAEDQFENSATEYIWTVGDPESMSVDLNAIAGLLEIPPEQIKAIDKLAQETRLAIRSPLLKYDPATQGLYNGVERIIAIMDERKPDTVDRYGVRKSERGEI